METVTLKLIAANLGVSERLVAYALSGSGRMGAGTRSRILAEAARQGYRPNSAARALASGRSGLLALCLPEMATAYGDAVTRILESRARASQYDLIVTRMAGGPGPEGVALLPPGLARVDGAFLLAPPRMPTESDLAVIRHAVIMGASEGDLVAFDHVRVDLRAAAESAVRCLLKRSPQRFAYLTTADFALHRTEARYAAYASGIRSAGLTPLLITLTRKHDLMTDAAEALVDYARLHPLPDAIMCSNDEIAIGVLRALRRLGRRAPRDVAVTGCDGIAYVEDTCPPLTTIVQPFEAMLELSWTFLMRRMAEPEAPVRHAVLEAQLVERESTKL